MEYKMTTPTTSKEAWVQYTKLMVYSVNMSTYGFFNDSELACQHYLLTEKAHIDWLRLKLKEEEAAK
jgi:hypothetical protein